MGLAEISPRLLINGKLVEASDKQTFPLYNPATLEKVAEVPEATERDTNAAVAAAKAAFPSWSALAPQERGRCLKQLAALIRENSGELAYLEAVSMGRPVSSYHDAARAAATYDHYAEAWPTIQGQTSLNTPGYVSMTLRQPYGVVAAIIPWNVPLIFLSGKTAPALMAGNTVVLKSSEKAPLAAARVAELVQQAGVLPPGVFNVVSGHGSPAGAVLSSHVDVRALSFTGSGRTGRLIQEAAAKSNLKKVMLELGGKSPAVIFEDADLEKAVAQTKHSMQFNSGQVCMANSRIYVQRSVFEKFVELFKEQFAAVVPGDPTSKATNHGPQADGAQYKTVLDYVEKGKKDGKLVLGGNGNLDTMKGYFIEPTIFLEIPEQAAIMREEIFGPVVNISAFDTENEVIHRANDTDYGLFACVYTKNIDRAMRVAKALESGYVGVNSTSPVTAMDMPFGGYKASGQGREGWAVSMENFLETKTVMIKVEE